MALELEFIVDTEGLQLDEVLPLSDLLELEILFEETLDFEMVVMESGGGTFKHDELTPESRAKADQHPIEAITDLQHQLTVLEAEQLAQWEAIQASEGASIAVKADPVPQTINTAETAINWAIFKPTTDDNILEFVSNRLNVKRAGRYFFVSSILFNKTVPQDRTITLVVRKYIQGETLGNMPILSPYPRPILIQAGIGLYQVPSVTVPIDIAEPMELVLTAFSSGSGVSFNVLETTLYTAVGGGSGLWKQNAEAHLFQASDINMQDKSLNNAGDVELNGIATEATYTPTVWGYLVGLFTTVPKSVKEHIVKIWGVVNNLAVRIGLLEDKYILKYVVPVNTTSIELTTDKYGNAFNFVEGTTLEIDFKIEAFVGDVLSRIYLNLNNTYCDLYWNTTTIKSSGIPLSGGVYYGELTRCNFTFYNGEIQGHTDSGVKQTSGAEFKLPQRYIFHTLNLNATSINSITLIGSGIPAGTVILIKKR